MQKITVVAIATLFVGLWFSCNITFADVYKYTDSDGIIHLTNAPNDPNVSYELVLKEKRILSKSPSPVKTNQPNTDSKATKSVFDQKMIAVVVVVFVAGFLIINCIIKRVRLKQSSDNRGNSQHDQSSRSNTESEDHRKDKSQSDTDKGDNQHDEQYRDWRDEDNRSNSQTWESQSEEYRHELVLGLKGKVNSSDVKKAYRDLLAKYHPDKVNHLGDEFKHIADKKTREIIAAYEYFRKKYNIT